MTLDELKQRATAAELTLIEATVDALHSEVVSSIKKSVIVFCNENPPIFDTRSGNPRAEAKTWLAKLERHLNPEAP